MVQRSIAFLLFMTAGCLALAGSAAENPAAAHPEMVVSAAWLAEHLKDPNVVVLHVGEGRSEYEKGHIAGARFLKADDIATGDDVELPSPERLKDVFEKLGVTDNSRIIIYTTAWWPIAGRVYYTLDYMGLGDHAALLDGGLEEWRAEKRPLSSENTSISPGHLTVHVHPEVRAMMEQVKQVSEQPTKSTRLVDARPRGQYSDGHIAGAVPLYWQETLVDAKNKPVFLPADKLKDLFVTRGIKPGDKVISYCVVGLQASHVYFVAKYLGYDAAMFDGSMHQWVHMNRLPTVHGEAAR